MNRKQQFRRHIQIIDMYRDGHTMREISEYFSVHLSTVSKALRKHGISRKDRKNVAEEYKPTQRDLEFVRLYRGGKTLAEIGDQYGITRERVRQCLARIGVTSKDGGAHYHAKKRAQMKQAERNAGYITRYGCGLSEYKRIRGDGHYHDSPVYKFVQQRGNAKRRGIPWNLNLPEWWSVWEESGKWGDRGRGSGYVMARINDDGAYELGNVRIIHSVENSLEYYGRVNDRYYADTRQKWGLPA